MDTIGTRLKKARGKRRQQDVATAADVTTKTLSRWENDETDMRCQDLLKIAEVLKVNPLWLLTGRGEEKGQLDAFTENGGGPSLVEEVEPPARRARSDAPPDALFVIRDESGAYRAGLRLVTDVDRPFRSVAESRDASGRFKGELEVESDDA